MPLVNLLLSGVLLIVSNCSNDELLNQSSLSSIITKYDDISPSVCVSDLKTVETGPTIFFVFFRSPMMLKLQRLEFVSKTVVN